MERNIQKPSIRFKGFTDAWEQRKINEIFDAISSGNRLPKDNLIEGKIPYVIAMVSNNGIYKHISSNTSDFHGNKMKLFQSPSITFSIDNPEAIFVQNKPFYTSNIMRVLHNIDLDEEAYLFIALQMKKLTKHFDWSLKFSGPVVSNLNISFPIFNGEINFKEVKRIGGLIREIDSLITLHQRKYDKLVNTKKALLDKMFPKNGELVPKIRFKGFTDAWEQRLIENLGEIVTGSTPTTSNESYYSSEGIPWVTPTDIENNITSKTERMLTNEGVKVARIVPKNTILVTCIASIGKNTLLGSSGSFNQQINAVIPNKDNDPYFIYTLSNHWSNHMKKMGGGLTFQIVNKTEFSNIETTVPKYDEQKKIGELFYQLDNLITLHQSKYEKLKNIKKALLQKMFV